METVSNKDTQIQLFRLEIVNKKSSFSAVSAPIFAGKYALFSIF